MSLRFLTAGESHGPELTAILEGLPAGIPIDLERIDRIMARRRAGLGTGGRMRIERDRISITGGAMAGRTTGGPIALRIANLDHAAWANRDIDPMTVPRPGHADLAAAVKYGYRDLRLSLERASARETAARTAVGALCALLLSELGVEVGSYVTAIGDVVAELGDENPGAPTLPEAYRARFAAAEACDVRCPDPVAAEAFRAAIRAAVRDRDTLGGVFEVVALGVPPGLGSHVHWDRRLSGRIMAALGSIPAVKAVEIGPAWENARRRGTAVHDRLELNEDGALVRLGGRSGGIEGGITTGDPLVVPAAMKPISTTLTPLPSVDLATGRAAPTEYERSDFCAVPRAGVVGEAMLSFVLADALIEKLGGDSLAEMLPRLGALRRAHLDDLPMEDEPWRFGYGNLESGGGT